MKTKKRPAKKPGKKPVQKKRARTARQKPAPKVPASIQPRPSTYRKPVTALLHKLFNFDPARDFGILDELVGVFFVGLIALTTITVIFGKEITTTWVATTDTDWNKGARSNVEVRDTGASASLALTKQGGGWTLNTKPTTENITQVALFSSGEGFAVGENATILRTLNGGASWQAVAISGSQNLWGISFVNESLGFAVGDTGAIYQWNGNSWQETDSPTLDTLSSVSVKGQNGFAVGSNGRIIKWNGSEWSEETSPTTNTLFGVSVSGDRAFAVGDSGTIVTWTGAAWESMDSPTTKTLLAVRLLSSSFGIAVGEGGTVLHWNGTAWIKKTSGTSNDLNAVSIAATNAAIAGGANGTVAHWNGTAWRIENVQSDESIFGVAYPNATSAVAVGTAGLVAQYTTTIYDGEGTYTSPTIDAEKEVTWDFLQWNQSAPQGTSIKIQIAANKNNTTWNYQGPDGTDTSFYANPSGQSLPETFSAQHYFRYRVSFATTNQLATPLLQSVTVRSKETIEDEPPPKPKEEEKPKPEPKDEPPKTPEPPKEEPKTPVLLPTPASPDVGTPTSPTGSVGATASTPSAPSGYSAPTVTMIAPRLTSPEQNALVVEPTFKFQWEPTETTPSYTIEISRTTDFAESLVRAVAPEPFYILTTPLTEGAYFWRVRSDIAPSPIRSGSWSSTSTFTRTDKAPLPRVAAPTLSKTIRVDSSEITLEGIAFPYATVRIIISSNLVERIVTADENGVWRAVVPRALFDGGQHLVQAQNIVEGQITAAITIGEFFVPFPLPPPKNAAVATARAVQATAEKAADATKKAARKTVEQTVVVAEKTQEVIKENETEAKVTLAATVPIVTAANPTVLPALSNLHFLFYHFVSGVLSLFGIKKRRKPWGMVYDAITKEPIGLAIVRLFESDPKKLIETQVTDNEGRFGFLVKPANYRLEVMKQDFAFPSKIVSGKSDGDFDGCYYGDTIPIKEGVINVAIPLDPTNKKEARKKQPLLMTARAVMHTLALPLLIVGWGASWLVTLFAFSTTNLAMTTIYLFFAVIHVVLSPKILKPWGTVFATSSLEPVPLAVISIVDTKFNRVLKTRLTDYSGRFNFLPPAGEYKLTVKKEGFAFPVKDAPQTKKFKNLYVGQDIIVKKEKAIVNTDVPVRKQ